MPLRYCFADATIASAVPLPELLPARRAARSSEPSIRIDVAARPVPPGAMRWLHRWRLPDGRIWMRVAPRPHGYIVRFDDYGDFEIAAGTIICRPAAAVDAATFRHLLLDQVLPAALGMERHLVLHASAVALDGRAVAFVGRAGIGKSTLAAAMLRHGAPLVTDDALIVDVAGNGNGAGAPMVQPTYPGVRLWAASRRLAGLDLRARSCRVANYTRKRRWSGAAIRFRRTPLPLAAVYIVGCARRPAIRAVTARRAVMALVSHSMLLDPAERRAAHRTLEQSADLARRVPVRRFVLPDGARALRRATDLVVQDLG